MMKDHLQSLRQYDIRCWGGVGVTLKMMKSILYMIYNIQHMLYHIEGTIYHMYLYFLEVLGGF